MKIKRLLALFVGVVVIVFFTLPSMLFGDSANTTTVDQDPVDDWTVVDDTRFDGDSFEVQEADPAVYPDDPNDGEVIDVYCLDWISDDTQGNGIHIGDNYDEANPPENHVEDLVGNDNWVTDNFEEDPLPNPGATDSLTDEMSESAIEILSSVATGASEVEDQLAVWSYTDNLDENIDPKVAAIEDAVSRIVEENYDGDADIIDISTLNNIDIALESGSVTLNSSGQDTTGKEITVTMEDPLVPGITDDGKTVNLYILGGSVNISFSSTSLVTDASAIMDDVVDGLGDHDGIATSRYYFYYWGPAYDPTLMVAIIGGWVDIDEDGKLDANNPDPNYVPAIDIVSEADPSTTYQLSTSNIDNTTVPGGTILIPMEMSPQGIWVYNSSNQRLVVKAYEEQVEVTQQSNEVVYDYGISFDKNFEGTPPTNAEFDIYADDGTGNPTGASLGHDSLGDDGTVNFTNLPPGNYVIVETFTPPGYTTMGYILITIAQDGSTSGLPESAVENNREEEERYDISFGKVFAGLDEGEEIPGGAQFTIFDSSGTTPLSNPDILGANPVTITHSDETVTFSGVVPGTYIIKETLTPPGYATMANITVTLGEDGSISGLPEVVRNDPKTSEGEITVIKKDEKGNLLDGVGFTLYYKDSGNPVMPERFTSGGMVTFDGLAFGTYILKETTPPAGYDTSDPVEITIDASNVEAGVTITRIDTKTPPGKTPPPSEGGVQVLGIQELPFTGMNPAIPISGISTILAAGLMAMLLSIRRSFKRK